MSCCGWRRRYPASPWRREPGAWVRVYRGTWNVLPALTGWGVLWREEGRVGIPMLLWGHHSSLGRWRVRGGWRKALSAVSSSSNCVNTLGRNSHLQLHSLQFHESLYRHGDYRRGLCSKVRSGPHTSTTIVCGDNLNGLVKLGNEPIFCSSTKM